MKNKLYLPLDQTTDLVSEKKTSVVAFNLLGVAFLNRMLKTVGLHRKLKRVCFLGVFFPVQVHHQRDSESDILRPSLLPAFLQRGVQHAHSGGSGGGSKLDVHGPVLSL